jgi:hypothetical protein
MKNKMNRKQSQNRMTMITDWLELFYLQTALPEQNDIIPLQTISPQLSDDCLKQQLQC